GDDYAADVAALPLRLGLGVLGDTHVGGEAGAFGARPALGDEAGAALARGRLAASLAPFDDLEAEGGRPAEEQSLVRNRRLRKRHRRELGVLLVAGAEGVLLLRPVELPEAEPHHPGDGERDDDGRDERESHHSSSAILP